MPSPPDRAKPTDAERTGRGAAERAREARAREESLEVRLRSNDPYPVLRIRNPLHATQYWVHLPAYPDRDGALCTCPDFARRGMGTCKHLEATWLWLEEHPTLPETPPVAPVQVDQVWAEVDRRLTANQGRPLDGRRLRSPGSALVESIDPPPPE